MAAIIVLTKEAKN